MYRITGADQKEYGSVTADQLRQWVAEGRVNGETPTKLEGDPDWQPLSHFAEFADLLGAPQPASALPAPAPAAKPPAAIKVFGVINIVLGSLGLLCSPLSIIGIPMVAKQYGHRPLLVDWLVISTFVSLIGAVLMLASGIGLCKFKSWARKLAVYYAIFACAMNIVGAVITFSAVSSSTTMEGPAKLGGFVGGVFGVLIGLTYNILLIVFLTQRPIKEALGEVRQSVS